LEEKLLEMFKKVPMNGRFKLLVLPRVDRVFTDHTMEEPHTVTNDM
jgi:hypothetical protein